VANYENPKFDRLFAEMKGLENGPRRLEIIDRMNRILQHDAPWVFGFYSKSFTLRHAWLYNRKSTDVVSNILKYQRLDPVLREKMRHEWNAPVVWPLLLVAAVLVAVILPAVIAYRRRERGTAWEA
jgi:hypothetical protein